MKKLLEYLSIIGLASLSALSYIIFIFPNSFAPAGFNGIATMIQHIFGVNVGYLSLLFNIPLIIAVFIWVDKEFAVKTFVFISVFSVALIFLQKPFIDLERFIYQTENGTSKILGPVVAGIIGGWILGVVFMENGCSGGTELVAALIHKVKPTYNFVWVSFILNAAVAIVSYFVYDFAIEPVILCIIYSFFLSNQSDKMLKGSREAVKFEIITSSPDDIAHDVMKELGHAVTLVNAEGCYTHAPKSMLYCVVNKDQIVKLKQILDRYPGSFACISSVASTVGKFSGKREENAAIGG